MVVTLNSGLQESVDRLADILLRCPMKVSFRTVYDDFNDFYRRCDSHLTLSQKNFCRATDGLRGQINDGSSHGQLGYWSHQWDVVAGSGDTPASSATDKADHRPSFLSRFLGKKSQPSKSANSVAQSPAVFKEQEAGFGVILSPPVKDFVGRRLHLMANFFMEKKQCDTVLGIVEKDPAALFHFIAPTLTEGETPPLLQGIELCHGERKHVSQFAKIYVHSMTNGTSPKSCCVPYDLKRGNPSGQLIRLG